MELLLFWSLMAYGMTSILVWGSIFQGTREFIKRKSKFLGELISCTLCTSTWVGFFLSFVTGGLSGYFYEDLNPFLIIFLDGMFTAGIVWAINAIIEYYENRG